jgi:hypothetical protein
MKNVILGYVLFGLMFVGCTHAVEYRCPESILVDQAVSIVAPGWESVVNTEPHLFDRVALYYRHPSNSGAQVPDDPDNREKSTWTIVRRPGDDYFWIGCHYQNTSVVLAKQVDEKATKCVALYEISEFNKQYPKFLKMICK